jgi:vacuolar-type H+-ATPase subunit I/STV1
LEALRDIKACLRQGHAFVEWYVEPDQNFNDIGPLQQFQEELAATAGSVMTNVLAPRWQRETDSLLFDRSRGASKDNDNKRKEVGSAIGPDTDDTVPTYVATAEEFFVLPYLGFIQNTLGRMRTIILGSLSLFVATTFAVSSYPFDPLPVLGGMFLAVFVIAGGTLIVVFAQMHRDATLSHITNTQPDQLDGQFWLHLLTFGLGPLVGLLTTLFPSITDFVSAWLQPGMQALK